MFALGKDADLLTQWHFVLDEVTFHSSFEPITNGPADWGVVEKKVEIQLHHLIAN